MYRSQLYSLGLSVLACEWGWLGYLAAKAVPVHPWCLIVHLLAASLPWWGAWGVGAGLGRWSGPRHCCFTRLFCPVPPGAAHGLMRQAV